MRFWGWFRRKSTAEEETSGRSFWRRDDASAYILTGDELGRLDVQHVLLQLAAGKNYRAPIRQPRAILDVGCGTGTWGRQLAVEFPRAEVVGFDINEDQVRRAEAHLVKVGLPANFRFLKADALQPFPFADESFDFTHARLLSPFVPVARWPDVVAEIVRVTRRGGNIELVDFSASGSDSTSQAVLRLWELSARAMQGRGLYAGAGPALAQLLEGAGVQRVQVRKFVIGEGRSATRQQRLQKTNTLAGLTDLGDFVARRMQLISPEEYQALLEQARDDLARPESRIYTPFYFVFGVKL
jgi:ubiquinone/menaquinone biosynthesis C-methylase UbiE